MIHGNAGQGGIALADRAGGDADYGCLWRNWRYNHTVGTNLGADPDLDIAKDDCPCALVRTSGLGFMGADDVVVTTSGNLGFAQLDEG